MPRFLSARRVIVPRVMEYALPAEPIPYDPQKARQLLAEAGYPNGFDAGELLPIPPFTVGEAVVNSCRPSGSGSVCGPWSGQPFSPPGVRRSYRDCW